MPARLDGEIGTRFAGSWKRMFEKLDGSCKMRSKEFEGVLE